MEIEHEGTPLRFLIMYRNKEFKYMGRSFIGLFHKAIVQAQEDMIKESSIEGAYIMLDTNKSPATDFGTYPYAHLYRKRDGSITME